MALFGNGRGFWLQFAIVIPVVLVTLPLFFFDPASDRLARLLAELDIAKNEMGSYQSPIVILREQGDIHVRGKFDRNLPSIVALQLALAVYRSEQTLCWGQSELILRNEKRPKERNVFLASIPIERHIENLGRPLQDGDQVRLQIGQSKHPMLLIQGMYTATKQELVSMTVHRLALRNR